MFRFSLILVFTILTLFAARSQTPLLDSIINSQEAKMLVEHLASDSLLGRFTGTKEATKAAVFISNEFKKAGVKAIARNNGYLAPFLVKSRSNKFDTGYNVLSAIEGKTKPDELIIFSAHYDHVGTFSTNPFKWLGGIKGGDSIYNGANDNASGVTAVILLARYFAAINNNARTLVFIAFSGEELQLLGSRAFSLQIQPERIKAMINIEMIGRAPSKKTRPFITGSFHSNLKSLLNDRLSRYDKSKYGKSFFVNDPYPEDSLFRRSDNWWFANMGIPAHTIMLTSPHDKFYHSVNDELETIDFNMMNEVIKAIAAASESLVDGTAAPDRIKNKIIDDRY